MFLEDDLLLPLEAEERKIGAKLLSAGSEKARLSV
jgi:hypothetical protein